MEIRLPHETLLILDAAESKKWSKLALIIGLIGYGVVVLCCILGALGFFGSLFTAGTIM